MTADDQKPKTRPTRLRPVLSKLLHDPKLTAEESRAIRWALVTIDILRNK